MSKLDILLSRFEDVRKSGDQYSCKCPAHQDKTASLTVTEKDFDHLYLKCFAGCETIDILASVGMDWPDLFPDTKKRSTKPSVPLKQASIILEMQAWIVWQYANAIAQGDEVDMDKLYDAVIKIADISNLLGNNR